MNYSVSDIIDIVPSKLSQNFAVISWNVLHIIHELNYVQNLSLVINNYSINENLNLEFVLTHKSFGFSDFRIYAKNII